MTIAIDTVRPSLNSLPENFLVSLDNYSAISLQGDDKTSYLQGQVTCDVNSLPNDKLLTGAHCNAKGKVFSCFRLFEHNNQHILFQPKTTLTPSLAELKKFGVFAKVDISATDNLAFFALVGEQAADLLNAKFEQVPDNLNPVVSIGSTTLVYLAGIRDRYLIIDEKSTLETSLTSFDLPVLNHNVWQLLEIVEGFPSLTAENENEYVPQMLNMQAINGISFTKGCYLGQETVARMQYLGRNKKALFALTGKVTEQIQTTVIEKQLGNNWRKAGDITSYYQADDHQCYIQAVLTNDTDTATPLRIKALTENKLSLYQLPYTLTQES